MNQARKNNGEWVEVEEHTDGIYANGIKIANPYWELEKGSGFNKIEGVSL